MSHTPRTDALLLDNPPGDAAATSMLAQQLVVLARQLERELEHANKSAFAHAQRAYEATRSAIGAQSIDKWCQCNKAGTCLGCRIDADVVTKFGADGLTFLRNHLRAAPMSSAPKRLWLWKNFVDGRPEYLAFDNPYPCHPNGDPITLGEPCGYADFKTSTQGRHDVSEAEVIAAIKRASERPESTEKGKP